MNKIDKFLKSISFDSSLTSNERKEMKEEMKTHLEDLVKEEKMKGKTENEAVSFAINQFGLENEIFDKEKNKKRDW